MNVFLRFSHLIEMADPSDGFNVGMGSWSAISGLPSNDYARSVAVNSSGQYQLIGYSAGSSGVWRSSNYGSNWTNIFTTQYSCEVRGSWISQTGQYQAFTRYNPDYTVQISSNYGASFTTASLPVKSYESVSMSESGQWITVVSDFIYRSSNYGVSWTSNFTDQNYGFRCVAVGGSGQYQIAVCGNTDLGVFYSSNYGSNWANKLTGTRYQCCGISSNGQYLLVGSYQATAYYVSSNYGSNWATFSFGAHLFKDCFVSQSGKVMMIGGRGGNNLRVRVSTDYGISWSNTSSIASDWDAVDSSDDGKYILAGSGGVTNVYKSISPLTVLPPDTPTTVIVSGTNLTWTAPSQTVDTYTIYSYSGGIYTQRATSATNSIALASLVVNSSLEYAVKAINVAGTSAYSALSAVVNIPPGPPTGITGDGTNLSWSGPSGGADFYKLYINQATSYLYYISTTATSIAYSNLFIGSNIRYNVTANGNTTGESAYSASTTAITVSFASVPDNSVNGAEYVDTLVGVGTSSSNLTEQLQNNTDKFITPFIAAGELDIRSVVNSNFISPGFTLSSFVSSATTFLAISTSQTVIVPVESLPSSNAIFYIPSKQNDTFTLSVYEKPYNIINSGVSSFTIDGQTYSLGDVFQIGGKLFKYAAVGSLILLGQGFQDSPSTTSIYIRPRPTNNAIQYNWLGSAVSTFSLVLEGYSTFTLPYNSTSYLATNLSNGTSYSAYITNNDGNKASFGSYFRTVQPGSKPSIPQNVIGTIDLPTSTLNVNWSAPSSNGGATVGWYVLKSAVSTLKYNTYGTNTSITLPFVGYSTFTLSAVNDPGHSPSFTFTATV